MNWTEVPGDKLKEPRVTFVSTSLFVLALYKDSFFPAHGFYKDSFFPAQGLYKDSFSPAQGLY